MLFATGVGANTHLSHTGGGSNYLCMPHDPIYEEFTAKVDNMGILYGSEYQPAVPANNAPFSSQNARVLNDHNVPCTVCRVSQVSKHQFKVFIFLKNIPKALKIFLPK